MMHQGNKDIKMSTESVSAKPYAPSVKQPVLWCDTMHDILDYHERLAVDQKCFKDPLNC